MDLPHREEVTLSERIAFLRKAIFFSRLSKEDLRILAGNFHSRKYKSKEIIFHKGDDSRMLFVVMKGKVRIFGTGPAGNEISIRIFSEQDMIGEFAAIDGRLRSTTAQAVENCLLLEMEQARFVQCLREMPDLSMEMIMLLVGKLRWTTAYVETIAQYNTVGRLIQTLLHYITKFGKEIEAGKRYEVDLSMSQADLASMVGASREWLNRILRDWSQRGLIEYKRSKITVLDLPAVEKERDRRAKPHAESSE